MDMEQVWEWRKNLKPGDYVMWLLNEPGHREFEWDRKVTVFRCRDHMGFLYCVLEGVENYYHEEYAWPPVGALPVNPFDRGLPGTKSRFRGGLPMPKDTLCLNKTDCAECDTCIRNKTHRRKGCYKRPEDLIVRIPEGEVIHRSALEQKLIDERGRYMEALKKIRDALKSEKGDVMNEIDEALREAGV